MRRPLSSGTGSPPPPDAVSPFSRWSISLTVDTPSAFSASASSVATGGTVPIAEPRIRSPVTTTSRSPPAGADGCGCGCCAMPASSAASAMVAVTAAPVAGHRGGASRGGSGPGLHEAVAPLHELIPGQRTCQTAADPKGRRLPRDRADILSSRVCVSGHFI